MARALRIGGLAVVLAVGCWSLWPASVRESSDGKSVANTTGDASLTSRVGADAGVAARRRYAQSLMAFEPNQGQTDPAVKYFARGAGYSLFLTPTEAVFRLIAATGRRERAQPGPNFPAAKSSITAAVLRMRLAGSNPAPKLHGQDRQPGVSNYFLGKNPAQWRRDVPHYGRVQYDDVYPGVDLVYYGNQQQLEYDFLVAPGADPAQITLAYAGADALRVDRQGNLVLGVGVGDGELVQHRPVAYQQIAGELKTIAADYTLFADHRVGIRLGAYDHGEPLIIDPVLAYGTYLGGTGWDFSTHVAIDRAGNMYLATATASTDFPTKGAYQGSNGGGSYDVSVSKINAAGSALVYSTYLGGSDWDQPYGIVVDSAGNAYISGQTASSGYPTTVGALRETHLAGYDAFVTKLNPAGNDLVYSTFLGGQSFESNPNIAVDRSGNAYVAGSTGSTDFPTVNPIQANNSSDNWDAFISKLNPSGTALVYSTYLGGTGIDSVDGIAVDGSGNAYVVGDTASTNFPRVGARQSTYGGGARDGFISKINSTGSALVFSTYHGGSGEDYAESVAVDAAGNVYVGGYTASTTDFPLASARQGTHGGGTYDGFVSKLNAAGSTLVYSTFHGGTGDDFVFGIALDRAANAYLAGFTSASGSFPLVAPLYTPSVSTYEPFLSKYRADGAVMTYSTTLGQGGGNYEGKLAVDKQGTAYEGNASCGSYLTALALQPNVADCGSGDSTVSKLATPLAQPWVGDFDGDGKDDLFWRNLMTGEAVIWKSANSATQQSVTTVTSPDWVVAGVGDFDGDGKSDIFWRNVETGGNTIWKSANSATIQAVTALTDFNWRAMAVADFDGDGKADILWRNQVTGADTLWKSGNNATAQILTAVAAAWDIVGVGDFNNDGKADVLWRHNSSGVNAIWLSANSATQQTVRGVSDNAWRVVGVADVNGDAKADILWRNASTGADAIWLTTTGSTQQSAPVVAIAWRVQGVGDYTGDGQADVLWRNTATGVNVIWKSGKSTTTQSVTGITNTDWWPQS